MTESEKLLFKRALLDATCNSFAKELDSCEEDARCSAAHTEKMNEILGIKPDRVQVLDRPRKRAVIAAILAAVLLLTGCSAYFYRVEIGNFIVTTFKDHIEIKVDTDKFDYLDKIDEKYTLGYLPKGYNLIRTTEDPLARTQTWKNKRGAKLKLVQHHIGVTIGIDSSLGEAKTLEVNGCAVYYIDCEEPIFIWNDGKYVMILESEERLLIEEFEKIIRGIKTE